MSRAHSEQFASHRAATQPEAASQPELEEGALGDRVPHTTCQLCWYERLVWRGGMWMLQHRGPLSECTHGCHDHDSLLPSVS